MMAMAVASPCAAAHSRAVGRELLSEEDISMKSLVSLCCLLLLAAAPALAQAPPLKSPSEIAREQSPAVVVIEQLDESGNAVGQGSGFIVTPGGAIVTNLHVVQGGASVRVKLPNGDVYKTADLVDFDESKDIAVIKIKGFQLPIVRLGDSDRVEVGEAIVAISSPEGLTNSVSTGVISGVRRFETHRVFQITAPISHGSSGGALFDSRGALIGITTFVFRAGQNINFAVPINYARGMISDQVTTTLAKLPAPPLAEGKSAAAPATSEAAAGGEVFLDDRVTGAARLRLGLTPQEPMFARPDEALAFFYRLVEGIGRDQRREVAELTRTAAAIKTKETAAVEEYTIKYLSFYSGLTLGFSKPDQVLHSVELLVNWSLDDLKRTFEGKFSERKTADGKKYLEFKGQREGRQMIATLDDKGNVRSVRFAKAK
jgi:S1-C subfamily serine protease